MGLEMNEIEPQGQSVDNVRKARLDSVPASSELNHLQY